MIIFEYFLRFFIDHIFRLFVSKRSSWVIEYLIALPEIFIFFHFHFGPLPFLSYCWVVCERFSRVRHFFFQKRNDLSLEFPFIQKCKKKKIRDDCVCCRKNNCRLFVVFLMNCKWKRWKHKCCEIGSRFFLFKLKRKNTTKSKLKKYYSQFIYFFFSSFSSA